MSILCVILSLFGLFLWVWHIACLFMPMNAENIAADIEKKVCLTIKIKN